MTFEDDQEGQRSDREVEVSLKLFDDRFLDLGVSEVGIYDTSVQWLARYISAQRMVQNEDAAYRK